MGSFSPFHFVILTVVFAAYMAPAIVALSRNHPQKIAILLLNLGFGWSVLGWIGALIWALIKPASPTAA